MVGCLIVIKESSHQIFLRARLLTSQISCDSLWIPLALTSRSSRPLGLVLRQPCHLMMLKYINYKSLLYIFVWISPSTVVLSKSQTDWWFPSLDWLRGAIVGAVIIWIPPYLSVVIKWLLEQKKWVILIESLRYWLEFVWTILSSKRGTFSAIFNSVALLQGRPWMRIAFGLAQILSLRYPLVSPFTLHRIGSCTECIHVLIYWIVSRTKR